MKELTNLLEETKAELSDHGKTTDDVLWVGSRSGKYALSWDEFTLIANIEYDSGYGSSHIADDLVVVGDTWWLERGEYDGSEWWEYKTSPIKSDSPKAFSELFHRYGGFLDNPYSSKKD